MIAPTTRHILRTLGVRTIQKKLLGYPVRIPIEIGNLWRLLLDPRYRKYCPEQELVQRMLDTIRPTDVVYDVGAFLGIHSLLFSLHARLVVSIEPRPTSADTRDVLIRSNGRRNLVAVRAAIGSKAGSGYLGGHGSSSQLCQHGIPVSVTTIDALAQEHGSPDVIKVDVEGAEVEVLRGADASLRSCRVVFVEVHLAKVADFGDRVADVWDIVHRAGFQESATMQAFTSAGDLDQGRVHVVFERTDDGLIVKRAGKSRAGKGAAGERSPGQEGVAHTSLASRRRRHRRGEVGGQDVLIKEGSQMTITNDEKTGRVLRVLRVDPWLNDKWRLIAHGDGDKEATVTSLLDSHPGVEQGDRIRIHSEPVRVEKLSE